MVSAILFSLYCIVLSLNETDQQNLGSFDKNEFNKKYGGILPVILYDWKETPFDGEGPSPYQLMDTLHVEVSCVI